MAVRLNVRERDLLHQRLVIGDVLRIKIYFDGKKFDLEDNGLNTVLEDVDNYYDSGSNDPMNSMIFDGN